MLSKEQNKVNPLVGDVTNTVAAISQCGWLRKNKDTGTD